MDAIQQFCRRWKIRELALFGSVLRTDFRPDSDIDVLVTFRDDAEWGLLDHMQMQQELATFLHRPIDLVSKRALERSANWVRREAIMNTARVLVLTDEAGDGPRWDHTPRYGQRRAPDPHLYPRHDQGSVPWRPQNPVCRAPPSYGDRRGSQATLPGVS